MDRATIARLRPAGIRRIKVSEAVGRATRGMDREAPGSQVPLDSAALVKPGVSRSMWPAAGRRPTAGLALCSLWTLREIASPLSARSLPSLSLLPPPALRSPAHDLQSSDGIVSHPLEWIRCARSGGAACRSGYQPRLRRTDSGPA